MKYSLCIAGTGSGTGKTTITLGILRALKKRGYNLQPFKCGPDYIDPEFHKEASSVISKNLDSWMMGEEGISNSYLNSFKDKNFAVVEGVMGLFDGASSSSLIGSTAHIAKLLSLPVFLVVNARGIARTIAPLVKGFIDFADGVKIAGIIANNVGSETHIEILKESLEFSNLPPLVGALPRNKEFVLPERHLGLIPESENKKTNQWYDNLAQNIEKYFDLDLIISLSTVQKKVAICAEKKVAICAEKKVRVAIAIDKAFHFYYEDNLQLLREKGCELIPFSPLSDTSLPPEIDAIYIGGGYPEVFANELSNNHKIRKEIADYANNNLPIYAECGGLMYLSQGIILDENNLNICEMCSVLPFKVKMNQKLHRLGYIEGEIAKESILGPVGTKFKGHEFRWSSIEDNVNDLSFTMTKKLRGDTKQFKNGIQVNRTFASYTHIHFYSNLDLVDNFIKYSNKKLL